MNNKNNIQKLAVLTAMVAITAILFNNAVQSVSALYEDQVLQFIPYKHLAPNQIHEKYIGYHLTNDHVFLWYKNNDKNGFVLVQFLTDAQQKIQDETGIIQ